MAKTKKFSIYLLQEMHCSENTTATWSVNGAIKLCLAAALAPVGVAILFNNSPFSLKDHMRILKVDLLFVILKQMEGFSLWLQSTHQMMTTLPFLESFFSHLLIFIVMT